MRVKSILATLLLIAMTADVIWAEPILRSRRCRGSTRHCRVRWRPVADGGRRAGTLDNPSDQPAVRRLFNGRDLTGWSVVEKYDFARHGEVSVQAGTLLLGAGTPATGIRIADDFPRMNYEVTLEAKRIEGSDFFCGITFPVGDDYLSLILGGWGGGATGLSNLDNMSAIENETTGFQEFEQDQWYRVRLRVTDEQVEAWIDDDQIIDVQHTQHKLSIWWEQEPLRPFGIANWYTKAALRDIRLTRL